MNNDVLSVRVLSHGVIYSEMIYSISSVIFDLKLPISNAEAVRSIQRAKGL